jgi:hypothetical protein
MARPFNQSDVHLHASSGSGNIARIAYLHIDPVVRPGAQMVPNDFRKHIVANGGAGTQAQVRWRRRTAGRPRPADGGGSGRSIDPIAIQAELLFDIPRCLQNRAGRL